MNTNTTNTTNTDDAAATMDSWTMTCSLMVGLRKTIEKAHAERDAILAAHAGNPFAQGVATKTQLIETLIEAQRSLFPDLHRIARSSGLPLPEGV